MRIDGWTLALQAINFAILVWLLQRFLYKPVLRAASAQANEVAAQRNARAEAEATALLGDARDKITRERTHALIEARRIALDLGVDVARRLLAEVPVDLRAEAWLDRIEEQLRALDPKDRACVNEGLARDGELRVVSAIPLPERLAEKFRCRLRAQLGAQTRITFDVDPEIVSGIELQFPNLILRFSWRAALAAMRAEIEANANTHA